MEKLPSDCRGYTIIELVIIISLIGIVAATGFSRIIRSDTYNPALARDQIVSMARSAQQKSIGRSDVELTIQPVGEYLELRIQDSTGLIQSARTPLSSVAFAADVNELDSCAATPGATTLTNAAPLVLSYSQLGDLLEGGVVGSPGYPAAISSGVRVCVNEDPAMSVCWSAAGFAYVGDCVD